MRALAFIETVVEYWICLEGRGKRFYDWMWSVTEKDVYAEPRFFD